MYLSRRYWILILPVVMSTLSGCGVWDAWRYRTSGHDELAEASDDESYPSYGIQPGHSTDPDQFNENYAPYSESPFVSPPPERIAPPPVPPTTADHLTREDLRLPQSSESENRLIKTLKSPRIFAPEGVRSIYDRILGVETPQPETPPESGPIAQNHILESPNLACRYDGETTPLEGPVQLGLPQEFDTTPEPWNSRPQQLVRSEPSANDSAPSPGVMQATPSSFRHPMFADPTGVPYAVP